MINTYDYIPNIIGMDTNAQRKPSDKLEIEIVPERNVFGIIDKKKTDDLISVLKDNHIKRINICFPLNESDSELIKNTFVAMQNMLDAGIRISMSNIDKIDKIIYAQQACENAISYFSKAEKVPIVEQHCKDNDIPFLPVASNLAEFGERIAEGYRVVKAYPFISNQLIELIKQSEDDRLLYNPAGGIIPVLKDKDGNPEKVNDFFLQCAELENVISINATDPAKCLIKSDSNENPLERFNKYLQIVLKG